MLVKQDLNNIFKLILSSQLICFDKLLNNNSTDSKMSVLQAVDNLAAPLRTGQTDKSQSDGWAALRGWWAPAGLEQPTTYGTPSVVCDHSSPASLATALAGWPVGVSSVGCDWLSGSACTVFSTVGGASPGWTFSVDSVFRRHKKHSFKLHSF